ncbi:MAG: M48 family metalloprotease [Bdellovibrionaceae bacterium]|nr:M48 family metalloprotease [Pseudobdellovibrionaceae bacterium]MDW8191120.1 M48 family metalloprotease [Pseudobdellovibrionaceae bacterium]
MVGYIGVFFTSLIKAYISRQREFFADAKSVQLTRNPGALKSLLDKVRQEGSTVALRNVFEFNHMFFAEATRDARIFFASHPPIEARLNTPFAEEVSTTNRSDTSFISRLPNHYEQAHHPVWAFNFLVHHFTYFNEGKSAVLQALKEEGLAELFENQEHWDQMLMRLSPDDFMMLLKISVRTLRDFDICSGKSLMDLFYKIALLDKSISHREMILLLYVSHFFSNWKSLKTHQFGFAKSVSFVLCYLKSFGTLPGSQLIQEINKMKVIGHVVFIPQIRFIDLSQSLHELGRTSLRQKQIFLKVVDYLIRKDKNVTNEEMIFRALMGEILGVAS